MPIITSTETKVTEIDLVPAEMVTECVTHLWNHPDGAESDDQAADVAEILIGAILKGYGDDDPEQQVELLDALIMEAQNQRRGLRDFMREVAAADAEAGR